MIAILDAGHGKDTPGKRSPVWPDGKQLFEWEFNRDIVRRVAELCHDAGIERHVLVPEDTDVPLPTRVRRANKVYDANGGDCVLFSIHANAGGGTGFECYTSIGETEADKVATILMDEAEKEFKDWKMRKDFTDGDPDKEAGYYIIKYTKMPAVLAEFFFMDTEKDCRLIMGDSGRQRCAQVVYKTILRLCL